MTTLFLGSKKQAFAQLCFLSLYIVECQCFKGPQTMFQDVLNSSHLPRIHDFHDAFCFEVFFLWTQSIVVFFFLFHSVLCHSFEFHWQKEVTRPESRRQRRTTLGYIHCLSPFPSRLPWAGCIPLSKISSFCWVVPTLTGHWCWLSFPFVNSPSINISYSPHGSTSSASSQGPNTQSKR